MYKQIHFMKIVIRKIKCCDVSSFTVQHKESFPDLSYGITSFEHCV
jgi:hypothetical protein